MRIRNCPGRKPALHASGLRAGPFVGILWALAGCLAAPAVASAQPARWSGWGESLSRADQWRIVVSPYTQHWRPSDEHRHV